MNISDEIREWCKWCDEHSAAREPRDRDGVPIHVGDKVCLDDGRKGEVTRIGIGMDEDSIYTVVYGEGFSLTPGYVTHERPDSWERIADELEAWCDGADVDGDACYVPRAIVRRIRRLAEKEGER